MGADVGGSTLRVGSEDGSEVGSRVALLADFLSLFPDFLALFPDFLDPPLALFVEIIPVLALDFFSLVALVLLFILEFLVYGISERKGCRGVPGRGVVGGVEAYGVGVFL